MSRTCLLTGPAGSGKTVMACLTAVRQPVYVIDIDNKVAATALLSGMLKSGALRVETLGVAFSEENLKDSAAKLSKNQRPKEPLGWKKFADIVDRLPTNGKEAGTWIIDSWTFAAEHLTQFIISTAAGKDASTLGQRGWGVFLTMCKQSIYSLIRLAQDCDKDLIVTIHERVEELPKVGTKVLYDADGDRQIVGEVELRTTLSVGGKFAAQMPQLFEEVYGLKIVYNSAKGGAPEWRCRVLPEKDRPFLRTSFDTKGVTEFSPNFKEIWR